MRWIVHCESQDNNKNTYTGDYAYYKMHWLYCERCQKLKAVLVQKFKLIYGL